MSWIRPLGDTGIWVSAIGLGTVKLGRTQGLKYPTKPSVPDDRSARNLLRQARELGINLLDTAPAYGIAEERLGSFLRGQRAEWVVCTKAGEEFADGHSTFDFSGAAVRASVHRSLHRLQTDYLDIVLLHSDGNDLPLLENGDAIDALEGLKREGFIRAFGLSSKTVEGGIAAAQVCDVVMPTLNLNSQEALPVLEKCAETNTGVLLKKVLASGQLATETATDSSAAIQFALRQPGVCAALVGTLSHTHLISNVSAAKEVSG